jgi:hypothetical protein
VVYRFSIGEVLIETCLAKHANLSLVIADTLLWVYGLIVRAPVVRRL